MNNQDNEHPERIDHPNIHERAREAFGWTEFGYIAASMYKLRDILPTALRRGLLILTDERFLLQRESPDELSPERVLHSLHRQ